jgi:hypothetical protein
MAHILIILDRANALRGNASEGRIVDFIAAVNAAHNFQENADLETVELIDGIFDEAKAFLADGVTMTAGAVDVVDDLTARLNTASGN